MGREGQSRELQDIQPPEEIRAAMEKQMPNVIVAPLFSKLKVTSNRRSCVEGDRDAAVADAEGAKKSEILRAEGDALRLPGQRGRSD